MKLINNNISKLKKIKRNAKSWRNVCEDFLNQKVQEVKLDGNNKHYKYLFNLIVIEHQQ